jgi:hypothetical protein
VRSIQNEVPKNKTQTSNRTSAFYTCQQASNARSKQEILTTSLQLNE